MRPERQFRTQALILRRRDFNESDRLLTILTPHYGKMDVIAKGARKPTSAKTGHVELFTRADMLIHTGRDFGIVAQAEMVEPFLALREDLTRGAYAAYAAELCDRFVNAGDEAQMRAFRLLDETLARICNEVDPRLALRYYEIQMLDIGGYRPELTDCAVGREPILPQDQYFSHSEGGVVCPTHAVKASVLVPVSMLALKLLRHMQRSPYARVSAVRIAPELIDEAERLLHGCIAHVLERRLQSVEFLRRLRRGGQG